MTIETKIMLCGVLVLGGFLWSYLFIRQLLFNFMTAHPMIRKMNKLQPGLIAAGARNYTIVSDIVCFLVAAVILFLIIRFCPLYIQLSFAGGALVAFLFIVFRMRPSNKETFDLFCKTYCRFVPDDDLRTILANTEYPKVKAQLKKMGIKGTFIPAFK